MSINWIGRHNYERKSKYPCWQARSLFVLVRKVEFFSDVFAQSSFGYQITSCFITQWLGNMRAVLSTCHAVPSLVNALKWTIVFSLLQRGSDELFSSCISNGPYIMNSGRGLPWRVNPFYGSACRVWFVCVAMTINPLFKKSQSLLFPPWLYLLLFFFLAANGNDTKKFKGDVRSPGVPSRVVHVRKLPNDINEAEVIGLGLPFGKVTNLLMLKGKNQVRTCRCRFVHQTCMSCISRWNFSLGLEEEISFLDLCLHLKILTMILLSHPCDLVGRARIVHTDISWKETWNLPWMSSQSHAFCYLQLCVEPFLNVSNEICLKTGKPWLAMNISAQRKCL